MAKKTDKPGEAPVAAPPPPPAAPDVAPSSEPPAAPASPEGDAPAPSGSAAPPAPPALPPPDAGGVPSPAPEPSAPPAPPAPPARKVWRTVAVAMKARTLYLGGQRTDVLGGEFITHPEHVADVRRDPGFRLVEVESPAHLEELRQAYAFEVDRVRRRAAELGLVVYRDGEVTPPRRK
jgi:hypothetical protein